jgi:predicted nucleic acid-binding protein
MMGARGTGGLEELKSNLEALPQLGAVEKEWQKALEIAFLLRKKVLRVDIVDLVVAATAINAGARLFHHDKHFKQIAGVADLMEYSFLPGR